MVPYKGKRKRRKMEKLIELKDVKKYFISKGVLSKAKVLRAVDGVTISIKQGETLGLVGESGCGKSTLAQVVLNLIPPTGGEIYYREKNLVKLPKKKLQKLRKNIQIVFQDPYSSLDPRMTVKQILTSPLKIHQVGTKKERIEKARDSLEKVGLPLKRLDRFPHEFSGGQRQRIGIARALMLDPEFIILDEPTSALDVSVQAQILNLIKNLQAEFRLTYLFISHDLSVVKYLSNRVAVMYLGKIVEIGNKEDVVKNPVHPYTQALFSAILPPYPPESEKKIHTLEGDVPDPSSPPPGCSFHARCPFAKPICQKETPILKDIGNGHKVACHLVI